MLKRTAESSRGNPALLYLYQAMRGNQAGRDIYFLCADYYLGPCMSGDALWRQTPDCRMGYCVLFTAPFSHARQALDNPFYGLFFYQKHTGVCSRIDSSIL